MFLFDTSTLCNVGTAVETLLALSTEGSLHTSSACSTLAGSLLTSGVLADVAMASMRDRKTRSADFAHSPAVVHASCIKNHILSRALH